MTLRQDRRTTGLKPWILVVHGSPGHARPVESLLESNGYEVVSASEPDEIAILARQARPDLVVVDGEDALAVAARLQRHSTAPMVVVSDASDRPSNNGLRIAHCHLDCLLRTVSDCLDMP